MADSARDRLTRALALAQAQNDAAGVAAASGALQSYDAKISGSSTQRTAEASTRPPTPPPREGPGMIRQGLNWVGRGFRDDARAIAGYFGQLDHPTPEDQMRIDRYDTAVLRATNAFGLGVPNLIADKVRPYGAEERRRQLYSDPANKWAGVAGDIVGGLASGVLGPARAVGAGVRQAANAAARIAPRALGGAAKAAQALNTVKGRIGLGTAEAAAINTTHNAIDPDVTSLDQGLDLALLLGGGGALLGGGLGAGAEEIRGRPDAPTEIGKYRDFVESDRGVHPPVPEGTPGYRGRTPHPNDVYNAGVAKGKPAEMRDVRDAAEEAAGQALEHRAGKSARRRTELQRELEESGYLDMRIPRQELIDEFRGQRQANTDPDVGQIDETLDKVLGKQQAKLETTRPAPKPVFERAPGRYRPDEVGGEVGPQVEQPELRLPAAPPIARPTPPMTRPTFSGEQERLPLGQPPIPPEGWRPPQPPLSLPPTEIGDHIAALARSAERDAARQTDFPFVDMPDHQGATGAQMEMRAPRARTPDIQSATPLEPPSALAGQQVEIDIPPQPPPIPGHEASGGVGPYQHEMPGLEPPPITRSIEEARGDPTVRALRRLRQQARARANFPNKNPTPPELRARAEYFGYDNGIKRGMEKRAPGYLDIEKRMGESAHDFRREGDLLTKTEGNLQTGGATETGEHARQADELDDIATEDAAEGFADINARQRGPRGSERGRTRSGKQQSTATFMGRTGEGNVPGQHARAPHEELAYRDPEYQRMQQLVNDVRSIAATAPGLRAQVPQEFNQAMANAKTGGEIVKQNLRFLGGRLGVPILEALGGRPARPIFGGGTVPAGQGVMARSGLLVPALRDPLDALLERRRREMEQQNEGRQRVKQKR